MKANKMKTKMINTFLLLLTALIWGTGFVPQSIGNAMGAYSFNWIHNFIGGIALIPVIFLLERMGISKKPQTRAERIKLIRNGAICGVALAIATTLQQVGISLGDSVGKAGFLTSFYIVLVPIAGLFFSEKPSLRIVFGVLLALAGLYLLCVKDDFSLELSDILLILCAVAFTAQIVIIDRLGSEVDPVRFSCIEFFVCALIAAIPAFFIEMHYSLSTIMDWLPILKRIDVLGSLLYVGVLSCGVAYTLQAIAQRAVEPSTASMVFSLESVFSVLAGWLLLHQVLNVREILGCVLIFTAVIISQLPSNKESEGKRFPLKKIR